MAYFLLKTEPSAYSYADLVRDGRTVWNGVKNPIAQKHIRSAKQGDLAVIYHTGKDKHAAGVAEITAAAYPDPKDPKVHVFDLAARQPLAQTVTLAALKAEAAFRDSPLLRMGRLSVVPLTAEQWRTLLRLGQTRV